jgi:hypothetical protein
MSSRTLRITGLVVVALIVGRLLTGSAQDTTEQRISALETRVATLEAEAFGTPVASPHSSPVPGASPCIFIATPEPQAGTFVTAERIVFSNEGTAVSENFTLGAGNYRVSVTVPAIDQAEHLGISIQPAPGSTGVGFAGLVNDYKPEGITGEFLLSIYTSGEFVIVADGNRPYTVAIELQ